MTADEPGSPLAVVRSARQLRRGRPPEGGHAGRAVVVVLGMHRSGTSLLANLLHYLGVDMADTSDHVSPRNAGGFWERPALNALHDEILAAIDRPIGSPEHCLPFPSAWWRRKEVQAIKPRLIAFVEAELARSPDLWGFKDPRTCRLLPLWWEVFRALDLTPVYLHAVRSPAEAAVSMALKNPARAITAAQGELMWLGYNYDVLRYVALDRPVLTVNYADWFDDGFVVARRLADALGIGEAFGDDDLRDCVATVVAGDHRHQIAGQGDAISRMPIASLLYDAMLAEQRAPGTGSRSLRAQMPFIGLLLKSTAPIVRELAEAVFPKAPEPVATPHVAAPPATTLATLDARIAGLADGDLGRRVQAIDKRMRELHLDLPERLAAIVARLDTLASAEPAARRRARTDQLARRGRDLLAAARRNRDALAIETARAVRSAGEARTLAARLEIARDRAGRLAAAVSARDRAIAALTLRLAERAGGPAPVPAFPAADADCDADVADRAVEGAIDRVDRAGIAGWARFAARPDLAPIVELLIDGGFATAQACRASDDGWRFSIDWRHVAPEAAGQAATVRIAGSDVVLDGAAITVPGTQRRLHQPPAGLAAELFGGSADEAQSYADWLAAHGEEAGLDAARSFFAASDRRWPLISVVVFGDGGRGRFDATIAALRAQVYPHWEALCVAAPAGAESLDPRVRAIADGRLRDVAAGTLATFVEAGDLIAPTALLHLAVAAGEAPDFALIYSDEDLIDPLSGVRGVPYMKGAWSDDLALAQDYASRLALVPAARLPERQARFERATVRMIVTGAATAPRARVAHLPFVLYHRSDENRRIGDNPDIAPMLAHLARLHPDRFGGAVVSREANGAQRVRRPLTGAVPMVSLVVPTRDRLDLLRVCVDGLLDATDYPDVEVLIADNASVEPETHGYLRSIVDDPRVRVIACPGPFDFAAINNRAVEQARGAVIALVNNDLAIVDPGWLRRMVEHAMRADVGIVGAKLRYGDDTIQHAGIVLGIGTASHLYRGAPASAEGRGGRLVLTQDVSAVTGACMVMRRTVWNAAGGFDAGFPVAYNDVDLCLRVAALGYRIVWDADAIVHHLESQSRGRDDADKRARLDADQARFAARWTKRMAADPFYSPNLATSHVDARLAFPPRVVPPWGHKPD